MENGIMDTKEVDTLYFISGNSTIRDPSKSIRMRSSKTNFSVIDLQELFLFLQVLPNEFVSKKSTTKNFDLEKSP